MSNELMPTRQEITSNLYALRAGLSVVSQEVRDAQLEKERAIRNKERTEKTISSKKEKADREIRNIQSQIDATYAVIDENKEVQNTPYDAKGKSLSSLNIFLSIIFVTFILAVAAYSVCCWLYKLNMFLPHEDRMTTDPAEIERLQEWWLIQEGKYFLQGEDREWYIESHFPERILDTELYKWFGWIDTESKYNAPCVMIFLIDIPVIAAFIGGLIWFGKACTWRNDVRRHDRYVKKQIEEADHKVYVELPLQLKNYNEQKENAEQAKREVLKECMTLATNADETYNSALKKIDMDHVKPARAIYESLKNSFLGMIDERDWASLDYIIYSVETGRADTIKEALQLLDREKQTDRIVAAIATASAQISQLLTDGFMTLRNQMTQSFLILSRQIAENTAMVIGQVGHLAEMQALQSAQTEQLSARVATLTTATALNGALMEKANESSEQLVKDIHQIAVLEGGY